MVKVISFAAWEHAIPHSAYSCCPQQPSEITLIEWWLV